MKTIHIVALVLIAASIAVLISFMGNVTTYDTIASAKKSPGKFVHLIVKLDKSQPINYNPIKDPNYLTFMAVDSLGNKIEVVYHNAKPDDMEKSERLGLMGRVQNGEFDCQQILLKCPSKYKDDPNAAKQSLKEQTSSY